jgi:hypothetical protein
MQPPNISRLVMQLFYNTVPITEDVEFNEILSKDLE